jgi:hypothetical protein
MTNTKKPFVKINIEDLEYAKEFFDNVADYSVWLYAVTEYYCGNEVHIKKKIVKKYFDNYKKTMNIVLEAKENGKKGALKRIEKQLLSDETLEAPLEDPLKAPLAVNNKEINNKDKYINIPELNEFLDYAREKVANINLAAVTLKYESWIESGWCTNVKGKEHKIKNWKSTLLNTLPFLPKHEIQQQRTIID